MRKVALIAVVAVLVIIVIYRMRAASTPAPTPNPPGPPAPTYTVYPGVSSAGADIALLTGNAGGPTTVEACMEKCSGTPGCAAASWDPTGFSGPGSDTGPYCALKSSVTYPLAPWRPTGTTYVRDTAPPLAARAKPWRV